MHSYRNNIFQLGSQLHFIPGAMQVCIVTGITSPELYEPK